MKLKAKLKKEFTKKYIKIEFNRIIIRIMQSH